jgi:hypothetical protein
MSTLLITVPYCTKNIEKFITIKDFDLRKSSHYGDITEDNMPVCLWACVMIDPRCDSIHRRSTQPR